MDSLAGRRLCRAALGVPRATIYADYHLSTTYRHPEWELPRLDPAKQAPNSTGAYFAAYSFGLMRWRRQKRQEIGTM
mgnify:CR=1 FL=1